MHQFITQADPIDVAIYVLFAVALGALGYWGIVVTFFASKGAMRAAEAADGDSELKKDQAVALLAVVTTQNMTNL